MFLVSAWVSALCSLVQDCSTSCAGGVTPIEVSTYSMAGVNPLPQLITLFHSGKWVEHDLIVI